MKKTKLFTKLFLSTLFITLFITLLAHELLFFLAPVLGTTIENEDTATSVVKDFSFLTEITFQADDYISGVIRSALPYSMLVCCIVSLGFSYFFSKAISAPITRIAENTSEMAKLNKAVRCSENSCYEITILSQNINNLYGSLLTTIENLESEKASVSESEKMKVDFLRSASHELKTPITALNAILENMILGVGKYKDYATYLPKCKEISEQLGNMICEILNTSKMNLLADDEEHIETDIHALITELCITYQTIAKSKGQFFKLSSGKIQPVITRPNLFRKALSNILTNAILYTKPGGRIEVTLTTDELVIENECTPIAEEHLKHIFEPFYRPEYSRNRNTGGNGLGLYLTATILEALDFQYDFSPSLTNDGMRFKIYFKRLI